MEIHIFHIKIQLKCGLSHHIFREDNYMCANVQGFWILQFEDSIGYFLFLEFISHWIPNIHIFHIQKQNFTSSLPLWFWRKTLSVWAHLVKKVFRLFPQGLAWGVQGAWNKGATHLWSHLCVGKHYHPYP